MENDCTFGLKVRESPAGDLYITDKIVYRCSKCGTPLISLGEHWSGLCKECGVEKARADKARAEREKQCRTS